MRQRNYSLTHEKCIAPLVAAQIFTQTISLYAKKSMHFYLGKNTDLLLSKYLCSIHIVSPIVKDFKILRQKNL